LKDGHPCLGVRLENAAIDELAFEAGKEAFAHLVVVEDASAAACSPVCASGQECDDGACKAHHGG
jgi:hypothetical protein